MSAQPLDLTITSPYYDQTYPDYFTLGEKYVLSFPITALKASLKHYPAHHFNYLIPQYLRLVSALKSEMHLIGRVKATILQMATPELPTLAEVADVFCVTPRKMQRVLAKEGLSFREILNELKKQISVLLLKHQPYKVKDISYLLGYAETASFVRAFYKWYGQTPKEYVAVNVR